MKKKKKNYRLSRALRVSENAFGILSSRFRILRRPIDVKVATTELIVKAACAIYNWLRMTAARDYLTTNYVEFEDLNTGEIHPGTWRQTNTLQPVSRNNVGYSSNHYNKDAELLRKSYAKDFSTILSVPWQLHAVQNT